jgi:RNA polymerase sigma-70 factor (ECF subfamily)
MAPNRLPLRTFDESTLDRVRRRDPAAMNAFFEAFIGPVYGYLRTVVREPMLADDLAQTAFLRLHRALDRLDPKRDPAPWVFTVVINTVRDHWRSRVNRDAGRTVPFDELWDRPEAPAESGMDVEMLRDEEMAVLEAAMARLSPADREILWLREFEGRSVVETAEMLGIRPDAVRQRHSRAVRRLGILYREVESQDEARRR